MLDIIRKKASAWGVKVIFGIIIIVFAFFFGYNRMSQKYRGTGDKGIVAKVNGINITGPEFELAYENTYKMYENILQNNKGSDLVEMIQKNARTMALNQLINQARIKSFGRNLNMEPTKGEIADAIRSSPVGMGENGKFDEYLYKYKFLPYFSQKYNIDYEYLVKGDLIAQKVQDVFAGAGKAVQARDFYDMENTKWTFEVAEYDTEDAAVAKKGGKVNKKGPMNVSGRVDLFGSDAGIGVYEKVFALTREKSALIEPLQVGGKWYTVKLAVFERPANDKWEKEREDYTKSLASKNGQEFFVAWMTSLAKKEKVKTYIEQ